MAPRRPVQVSIICVTSLCGRIGPGLVGSWADRARLEEMRAQTDASLIGAGTLRGGDAEMRGPGGRLAPERVRAVITASGDIPLDDRSLFRCGPAPVVFTGYAGEARLEARLEGRARVILLPEGPQGLSLRAAVDELGRLGAERILIEGGAGLNYAALSEGVVDEVCLTLAPKISGERGAVSLADGPSPLGSPFLALQLVESEVVCTGEVFLRYRVAK
jgi:2,5-diamino-6-(ribosylamino)-4(3H)-pyrimidinone 5'-phosphate reductase